MGTTANKLAYLNDTKTAIKTAIVGSGIDVPDGTPFRAYADKVDSIVGQFSDELDSIMGGDLTPAEPGKTIMPGTTEQLAIAGGKLAGGDIKVAGDANLTAENIAEGVSIFGVQGTHSGGGLPYVVTSPDPTSGFILGYVDLLIIYCTTNDAPARPLLQITPRIFLPSAIGQDNFYFTFNNPVDSGQCFYNEGGYSFEIVTYSGLECNLSLYDGHWISIDDYGPYTDITAVGYMFE